MTVYQGQPFGELFDLQDDPNELYNRWDHSDYQQIRVDLTHRLLDEIIRTDSVLPRRLAHA